MIGSLLRKAGGRLASMPGLGRLVKAGASFARQFPWIVPRGVIPDARAWVEAAQSRAGWYDAQRGDWHVPVHPPSFRSFPPPEGGGAFFRDHLFRRAPAAGVFGLRGAYLHSDEGTVISRDNRIFAEFAHHFATVPLERGPCFKPFATFAFAIPRRKEWIALLAAPECRNYYHWLFDVLPRAHLLEPYREQIELYAVPGDLTPQQLESLQRAGIAPDRLLTLRKGEKVYCERAIVPSLPGSVGAVPDWAIRYLRDRLAGQAGPAGGGRKLYISRADAPLRRLVNEPEIIDLLAARGFEIFEPARHGFAEQVAAFRDAGAVVGCHGAGLANLVFASRCRVLEIFSPEYAQADCYFTLARQLGHDYRFLLGARSASGWGDITVDTRAVAAIIDGWGCR